jgi:nucleoside-diphosphate-sugar epimerase
VPAAGNAVSLAQPDGLDWHLDKRTRSLMAHVEDIAQAVALALQSTEVRYDVFPVTSRSDVLYVDISKTCEMGYRPRWTFEADGTKHRQ